MVFLVRGKGTENFEKKKKTDKRKKLRNKEKKKTKKYRESKLTTINIFGFSYYIKIIF